MPRHGGRTLRLALALGAVVALAACSSAGTRPLPSLADEDFWHLATTLSEPPGVFDHPDNLVSNETRFAQLAQRLRPRGGAYIGVGPEQNFSYIARLDPAIAFIVDIREENQHLHLMYKALFELSVDRADFLARLFSRPRPPGIDRRASVTDLFAAFDGVGASAALRDATVATIRSRLTEFHRLPLAPAALASMADAHAAFFADGPDIRYGRLLPPHPGRPSYRQLMTTTDLKGEARSFLASDDAFRLVKSMHERNRIIPVVGDFAGPSGIRRVGDYVRRQGLVVSAFYASNVEVYLTRDERRIFCASLATLPYDAATAFISGARLQTLVSKLSDCERIAPSLQWP